MRHQSCLGFARTLYRAFLHHCHTVRDFRRRDDLPVSLGSSLQGAGLVRRGRSDGVSRHPHRGIRLGLQKRRSRVGVRVDRVTLLLLLPAVAYAAPTLRLSSATVGPASIAAGSNGVAQTVEAFNIGDGALAPAATSSVLWLAPSIGTARACTTRSGSCLPVEIALQTSAL